MRLIQLLENKRQHLEMTNEDFGRLFGHTGPWWSQIKHGKKALTPETARRAKRIWPHIAPAVDAFLLGEENDNDHVA